MLLHGRFGPPGSRLINGSTATVTQVQAEGLTVRLDRNGETAVLPASFVTGTRKDSSPNLSHSWARTVDGAQSGTWEACHLLGSCALDAYRGYTGQSRSRQPTHTWNTTKITAIDHGGILADRRDPAEQVADALARQPDPASPPEAIHGFSTACFATASPNTRRPARRPPTRPRGNHRPAAAGRGLAGEHGHDRCGERTTSP